MMVGFVGLTADGRFGALDVEIEDNVFRTRAKLIIYSNDYTGSTETILLHQRAEFTLPSGTKFHVHTVIDTESGNLVSFQTGRTDQDAWTRVRGDLDRKDLSVDA